MVIGMWIIIAGLKLLHSNLGCASRIVVQPRLSSDGALPATLCVMVEARSGEIVVALEMSRP
jgi:hypothetical protein